MLFEGDAAAICRANLWLRTAERVVVLVGSFPASDFGQLFDGTNALAWEEWIPRDGAFPIRGRSHKSQLSSVPACQKIVNKAVAERLLSAHGVDTLPESGAKYSIEVELFDNTASLLLDTSGAGLHKRGYRTSVAEGQLRETLAAAMVSLSVWNRDRPMIDPFCGTGTIAIEAALVGRNSAPGLDREFAAEEWPTLEAGHWHAAREEARDLWQPPLEQRIVATDLNAKSLELARHHAERAGVAIDIHFQQRAFDDLTSSRKYGCMICNPPYGIRIGNEAESIALHKKLPIVLRGLPTWSHYVLTARGDFERLIGQQATRRRKLYNGRIECTYYQFLGPKPPRGERGSRRPNQRTLSQRHRRDSRRSTAVEPVFGGTEGGLAAASDRVCQPADQASAAFASLAHAAGNHLLPALRRDVPDVPLVVDRYEDALDIAEYRRPHDRTPAEHADWLDLMLRTAAETLEVDRERVFLKRRETQSGDEAVRQARRREPDADRPRGGSRVPGEPVRLSRHRTVPRSPPHAAIWSATRPRASDS